jgi:hypothetical protein
MVDPGGAAHPGRMSLFIWTLVGIAVWHFTVFVPDRFAGGIVGAFLAAWVGALASGFASAGLRLPTDNPPGVDQVAFALPGCLVALAACYAWGVRQERREEIELRSGRARASRPQRG